MSKYDKKTLERVLDDNRTKAAERFAKVGLDFVARGGNPDEAKAKVRTAASVRTDASDSVLEASEIITAMALDHFEVNLDEAKAEAVVYLEKAKAQLEKAKEEAEIRAQAEKIIAEIVDIASDVQWPAIYVSSMVALNQVSIRIDSLRELGICGRPWKDAMSDTSFRFVLQSISKKYMPQA